MKLKRYNQINEELFGLNPKHIPDVGGITHEEYNQIKRFISDLDEKSIDHTITDEEKILSEVLYMILTKKKDDLNYEDYYNKRLITIKENKQPKRTNEERLDFHKLVWWLQSEYEWNNVETEGNNRVRFDWDSGKTSFWLNDDNTTDGYAPDELVNTLIKKGIKVKRS